MRRGILTRRRYHIDSIDRVALYHCVWVERVFFRILAQEKAIVAVPIAGKDSTLRTLHLLHDLRAQKLSSAICLKRY